MAHKSKVKKWQHNLPRRCNEGSYWSQCQSNQNNLGVRVHYCGLHSRFQELSLLLFPGQSVDLLTQMIYYPWKTNHFLYVAGYVRYFVYCFSKRARVLLSKGRRTENTKVSQHVTWYKSRPTWSHHVSARWIKPELVHFSGSVLVYGFTRE